MLCCNFGVEIMDSKEKQHKEIEALRAANRILEEENAQLSERAEDAMLLALVAEVLEGVSEPLSVIGKVLERISILKDLPYVTCGQLSDGNVKSVGAYASFSDDDTIGYPITLSPDVCFDLRHGPYIAEGGEGISTTFNDKEFSQQAVLIVPFNCHEYGSSVFLFLIERMGVSVYPAWFFFLSR